MTDIERVYEQEDEFGRLLIDNLSGQTHECNGRTVICNPDKMVDLMSLKQMLSRAVAGDDLVIEEDILQESKTNAYIYIKGKNIQIRDVDLFLRAVKICPVVEVLTKIKDETVEISFAINGYAKRI